MSYSVAFCPALDDDLSRLQNTNPVAAALWLELIDAIYDVAAVAYELTVHNGYRAQQPRFDNVPVAVLLRSGYNVSRIKFYRPDGSHDRHRLLYALDHSTSPSTIWLLGLMERATDYDPAHPLLRRVCLDYDRLGIPHVPCG